jgi:VanZ family protein
MSRFITLFRPYARILLAIWVVLIVILAIVPDIDVPRIVKGKLDIRLDYPIHFLEHTSLAVLAMVAGITDRFSRQLKRVLYILTILTIFAVFAETLQLFIPARSFDFRDMGLNILGSFTGTLLSMLLYRKAID